MSMFRDADVREEGFVPLQRKQSEPATIGRADRKERSMSFSSATGLKADEKVIWDNAAWSQMERNKGKLMNRSSSFVMSRSPQRTHAPASTVENSHPLYGPSLAKLALECDDPNRPPCIVVVDPFSTGAHLAAEVNKAGLKCARVLSIWDSPVAAMIQQGIEVEYAATVQHRDNMEDQNEAITQTIDALNALPFHITAVVAGAETGVELADKLSHRMGMRSNGEEGSLARRNKHLMGERVRNAGVRAVKQRNCVSIKDLREFLDTLTTKPFKCVVKPVQSAGTDDVFLCSSYEEAETAFTRIFGKVNGLGLINESALAQEFLAGNEFVIDKVSVDGVHKTVAIWEYDKRVVNGANFVYFGMRLRPSNTEKAKILMAYADECLDALGILQGPSHMEVMWCSDGPCLVEVGSRCQGGEGTWLPVAKECVGYTQVEACLDCYLGGHGIFKQITADSFPMHKFGRDVDMVNRHGGIIRAFKGEKKLRALESFRSLSWEVSIGEYSPITIDCFTRPGCAQFVHESEEQADADLEALHDMEDLEMFDYSVICPKPPSKGAVVVVDAFSTGANTAAQLSEWGYRLVLVFSAQQTPVKSLVTKVGTEEETRVVQHDNQAKNQSEALAATLKEIEGCNVPIVAILPGTDTGVELAERLATKFGCRCNAPEPNGHNRGDKVFQQETLRRAGLRSIVQKLCHSEADVSSFCAQLSGKPCVVKPNSSAGADRVLRCVSGAEAVAAFKQVNGKANSLGNVNDGALVQECLQGTEYALDGVSRDGQYKVTAIWRYDKRSANGADCVPFGMHLCDGNGKKEQALIKYAEAVNACIGIVQGPSHMEVMWCSDGPCLIKVRPRMHGGEGTWLPVVKECIGYTQIDATLNAYLRPDDYDAIPDYPTLLKRGSEAFLVALTEQCGPQGAPLKSIPGVDAIGRLDSFLRMELCTQPGSVLLPTIDDFTRPGSVQLVHEKPGPLLTDYERIRSLEKNGLFAI